MGPGEQELGSGDGSGLVSPKNKLELRGPRDCGHGLVRLSSGSGSSVGGILFLRCFFLVLRHTPGTPGTGLTSLLLTGGGCRMGLGARVRHTGRPAAHSRIPVMPEAQQGSQGGASPGPTPLLSCHWVDGGASPLGPDPSAPSQVEAQWNAFCGPRPP